MIPKLDTYSISFAVRHNSKVLKCIKFILFKMGKPFSTVATISLLKVLLILFNTLFWASGLLMLVIGVWMVSQLHKYIDLESPLASTLPVIFLGLSSTILILAALSYCCIAKGKVSLLYMYAFFLTTILLVESTILLCGYWLREDISTGFHAAMSNGLQWYGKEPSLSSVVDDIQSMLWCCGLSNFTDWQGTSWGKGHPGKLPYSCCQFTREAVCSIHEETAAVHRMGCYRFLINYILENGTKIGIVVSCTAFGHIVGVALTCLLARGINKANYEEIR